MSQDKGEFCFRTSDILEEAYLISDEISESEESCYSKRLHLDNSFDLEKTTNVASENTDCNSSEEDNTAFYPSDLESNCGDLGGDHSDHELSDMGGFYPSDYDEDDGQCGNNYLTNPNHETLLPKNCVTDDERSYLGAVMQSKCCSKNCMLTISGLNLITARRKVLSLDSNGLRQWLVDKLQDFSYRSEIGKLQTRYSIAGVEVCPQAWCTIHSISQQRMSRALKLVSSGEVLIEHGNKDKQKVSQKSNMARIWMDRYFNLIGDKMPHNSQIHLPSWETRKDIFMRYQADMQRQQIPESSIVVLSTFYKMWTDDFTHVVIPEVCIAMYV